MRSLLRPHRGSLRGPASLREWASFLLVSGFVASGCSSPPEVSYYSLRPSSAGPIVSPQVAGASKLVVLVDKFAIDEAYASDRLAYTKREFELHYDPYCCWAGPPVDQVAGAVRDRLLASRVFGEVRQSAPLGGGRSAADLVITGRVARLEEVDADDHWSARLELELYLLDGTTHAVLATKHFAADEPAAARNPREVAATLSGMVSKAVDAFVVECKPAIEGRKPRGS